MERGLLRLSSVRKNLSKTGLLTLFWVTRLILFLMFSRLPFTFLFLFVIIFGTLFSVSSSHWLGVWAGLEVNLIGFLPILLYQKRISERESAVKYFIIQALGSRLLIFGSLVASSASFTWDPSLSSSWLSVMILLTGLLTKIGLFPFHFWLPSVIAGLPWLSCIILATWQKVAPLFLVTTVLAVTDTYSIILLACVLAAGSSLIGGLGGINQTQIRAILAYSSIGHLGWIIFASSHSSSSIKLYFLIYILISLTIFLAIWSLNAANAKRLARLMPAHLISLFSVMVMLMSLAGLPPLLGFISKWVVLLATRISSLFPLLGLLILGSVISLFYYLRLYFSIFLRGSRNFFILTPNSERFSLTVCLGLLFNLTAGLCLIFLNFLKRIYALIIFDKP